jgi:hypothetical protein
LPPDCDLQVNVLVRAFDLVPILEDAMKRAAFLIVSPHRRRLLAPTSPSADEEAATAARAKAALEAASQAGPSCDRAKLTTTTTPSCSTSRASATELLPDARWPVH